MLWVGFGYLSWKSGKTSDETLLKGERFQPVQVMQSVPRDA